MQRKWTKQERDELKHLYAVMPITELSEHLGRSVTVIHVKANWMGLHKDVPNKIHLTTEQERWLKRNFPVMRNIICATYLGISERTVIRLARDLGLSKSPQFMKESQAKAAKKAKESHLLNGTYPQKGYIIPGSEKYRFKPIYNKQKHE